MIFQRGDVVLADLGYVGKVRPVLVVSIPHPDRERNMSVVAPITTEVRGGECEVAFPKPQWMREPSVVNLVQIVGLDNMKILRRLGTFPGKMKEIDDGLARMLGL
jgi:mRNA-degrading endonuclease toxin of MazEF toxin-antitoxin module